MKSLKMPLSAIALIAALSSFAAQESPASENTAGYQLVWSDEFDTDGKPNPENWTYERGFVRNEELQWYQADNAWCENGKLIIEGRREHKKNPRHQAASQSWRKSRKHIAYTSSCLITKDLHSWTYGRFIIKARIKTRAGLWPAIWFLGTEGHWPHGGEIDLMEYYGGDILANACWGRHDPRGGAVWDDSKTPVKSFRDPDWDEKFHTWRMDWDRDSIKLYLDDQLLNTIDLAKTTHATAQGPETPFHKPHYLLLNLAIGGTVGGDPSSTAFPTRYEIEHVRVYQKEDRAQKKNPEVPHEN